MSKNTLGRGLLILTLLRLAAFPAASAFAQSASPAAVPSRLPVSAQDPAGGTVGTGTPGSCTDAMLNTTMAGGGLVTFNCGASPVTITISLKTLASSVTIDGGGLVTLSGNNNNALFNVPVNYTLRLKNITLSNGQSSNPGGAISNAGTLIIDNSQLLNNRAFGSGGAIFNQGPLTISNSTIRGNRTAEAGGGISSNSANVALSNVAVISNSANFLDGGGIDFSAGQLTMAGGVVMSNSTSSGEGGGINASDTTLSLDGVTVS